MSQKKQLALSVQGRSLHALAVPGSADLNAPVSFVHSPITRHADYLGGVRISDGKGKHCAFCLAFQPALDLPLHLAGFGNHGIPELPELTILHGFHKIVMVSE